MRILVIGSGGREHALVTKLAESPLADKIFVAPGNGGTASLAQNVNLKPDDIQGLSDFAIREKIDLVVPGPELPLTLGIVDAMRARGIPCFGPDALCARLEGSKCFAKEIMAAAGVPTANSRVFTDARAAREYAREQKGQVVIKADGLAAGKGVVVADSEDEAIAAIDDMLEKGRFGQAGATILIEEKLSGEEVSLLFFCDGNEARPMPSAQDHKRAYDGDKGPNTGGMGAYSPAPLMPDDKLEEMADLVARPILRELAKRGHPYTGVLYAGIMLTAAGPKVLEYNVRFGDPECQPLMARLKTDLATILQACLNGALSGQEIVFDPRPALGVVLAAKGYPGTCPKGMPVRGIEDAINADTRVFQGGTEIKNNELLSTGGRVLCVTALGADLPNAKQRAYAALARISMPNSAWRNDIGDKGIRRLAEKKG